MLESIQYIDPVSLLIGIGIVCLISFLRFNQWTESSDAFKKRYSPRHYTGYSAFIKYQTAYVLLNLIVYIILLCFPGVAAVVMEHLLRNEESQEMVNQLLTMSGGSMELFLLLVFLVLPDYNKKLKQVENTIRERLQSKAGIPTKVREFISHCLSDPEIFKPQSEAVKELLRERSELKLNEQVFTDFETVLAYQGSDPKKVMEQLRCLWAKENFLLFRIKTENPDGFELHMISSQFEEDYQALEVLLKAFERKAEGYNGAKGEALRELKDELANLESVIRSKLKHQLNDLYLYISVGLGAFTELSQGSSDVYSRFGLFPRYQREPFFDWALLARTAAVLLCAVFYVSFIAFLLRNRPDGVPFVDYWKTIAVEGVGGIFGKSVELTVAGTIGFFIPVVLIFFFYDLMSGQQLLTEVGSRFFRRPSVHLAWYLFGFIIGYFVLLITLEFFYPKGESGYGHILFQSLFRPFYSGVSGGFSRPYWALLGGLNGIWALAHIKKFLHLPEEPWNIPFTAVFQAISFSLAALLIYGFKNDFNFEENPYPIVAILVSFIIGLTLGSVVPVLMREQYLQNVMNSLDRRHNKRINFKAKATLRIKQDAGDEAWSVRSFFDQLRTPFSPPNGNRGKEQESGSTYKTIKCKMLNFTPEGVAVRRIKKEKLPDRLEAGFDFPRIGEVPVTAFQRNESSTYLKFVNDGNERLEEIKAFYEVLIGDRPHAHKLLKKRGRKKRGDRVNPDG